MYHFILAHTMYKNLYFMFYENLSGKKFEKRCENKRMKG